MGYTTEFQGELVFDRELDDITSDWLYSLPEKGYQKAGTPDSYCQWILNEPRRRNEGSATISWDGGEKFYHYVEWLKFILTQVNRAGYKLNGQICWRGEEFSDIGTLDVKDNVLTVSRGNFGGYQR